MGYISNLKVYSSKILKPRKILVLSDIHYCEKTQEYLYRLLELGLLNPNDYEYIFIVGDTIHNALDLNSDIFQYNLLCFLKHLTLNTKTLLAPGNHEQMIKLRTDHWLPHNLKQFIEVVSTIPNIDILSNEDNYYDQELHIAAFNPNIAYHLKYRESDKFFSEELSKVKNKFQPKTYNIFLSHYPRSIIRLSEYNGYCIRGNSDLVVSGHMHNGLVPHALQSITKNRGFLSPTFGPLPDNAHGIKQIGDTIFLINGPVTTIADNRLINQMYGLNCTELELNPSNRTVQNYTLTKQKKV